MERRIRKVTQETIDAFYPNLNLAAFYKKVAEEFQMPVEEEYGFDCRKIWIAANIREQWYEQFEKRSVGRSICVCVCPVHVWNNIYGKTK